MLRLNIGYIFLPAMSFFAAANSCLLAISRIWFFPFVLGRLVTVDGGTFRRITAISQNMVIVSFRTPWNFVTFKMVSLTRV